MNKFHPLVDQEIEETYADYVSSCSTAAMAISIETARMMSIFCIHTRPKSILDFGSGFSTVCFALLKKKGLMDSVVTSVDASPVWLAKTLQYLEGRGLGTDALVPLEDFSYTHSYDFILHDIGNMGRRARLLPTMWNMLNVGGWIVIDDVHMPGYRKSVDDFLKTVPHTLYEHSRSQTLDRFRRFSLFVRKHDGSTPSKTQEEEETK